MFFFFLSEGIVTTSLYIFIVDYHHIDFHFKWLISMSPLNQLMICNYSLHTENVFKS